MQQYPLFFTLTHEIKHQNFIARVVSKGRVLLAKEDGEWWCHGVDPGGTTDHGDTPASAWTAFKASLGGIFEDLAEDNGTFDSFKTAVAEFVYQSDPLEAERWEAARQEIRANSVVEDATLRDIPKVTEDRKPQVIVERLVRIQAAEEEIVLAKAA